MSVNAHLQKLVCNRSEALDFLLFNKNGKNSTYSSTRRVTFSLIESVLSFCKYMMSSMAEKIRLRMNITENERKGVFFRMDDITYTKNDKSNSM